jgi:hypothetical protein
MATFKIWHGAARPIVARGSIQCRVLGFAERNRGWHTVADDRATRRAVAALALRGCLEVIGAQFRFTYPAA